MVVESHIKIRYKWRLATGTATTTYHDAMVGRIELLADGDF